MPKPVFRHDAYHEGAVRRTAPSFMIAASLRSLWENPSSLSPARRSRRPGGAIPQSVPPARRSLCAGGQSYPRQLVMLLCRPLCLRIVGMDVLTMPGTVTDNMPPQNRPPRRPSHSSEGHPAPSHCLPVCAPGHKHRAQALPFFQQSGTLSNFFDFLN